MKKFIFSIFTFVSVLCVSAEDVVQVEPFTTKAGCTSDDGEVMKFALANDELEVNSFLFDLYLPKGLYLDTSYDVSIDDNTALDGFVTERTTYSAGRKTASTNHTLAYNFFDGVRYIDPAPITGYSHYRLLVSQGTTVVPIQGTSGTLFTVYYVTDDTMADGVYPIYVKNIELLRQSDLYVVKVKDVTSYVVIGTPENQTLNVVGELPSFVNESLVNEKAITNVDNSKATKINGTLTLVDGRKMVYPDEGVKADVKYTRKATANKFTSLVLPFDATFDKNVCYYYAGGGIQDGMVEFTGTQTLPANTPAIVSIEEGSEIEITAKDVTLKGTTEEKTIGNGSYYLKNDKMVAVNNSAKVAPYRAYWDFGGADVKGFYLGDEETSILCVDAEANEDIYNLSGMKLNKAQKGVNIVNGKKILVK